MRGGLVAVGVMAATLTLRADPVMEEFKSRWATTKAFTLEVADAMPDADYGFKPTPGGPLPSDKPTVLKGLASSFDHCAAIADKLTPAQLDASYPVDWVGMPAATGRQILSAMFTHTAHHRGQAEVYLRLKGIVPPKYRY